MYNIYIHTYIYVLQALTKHAALCVGHTDTQYHRYSCCEGSFEHNTFRLVTP